MTCVTVLLRREYAFQCWIVIQNVNEYSWPFVDWLWKGTKNAACMFRLNHFWFVMCRIRLDTIGRKIWASEWTPNGLNWSPSKRFQSVICFFWFFYPHLCWFFCRVLEVCVQPIGRSDYGILNCSRVFYLVFSIRVEFSRSKIGFFFFFFLLVISFLVR
jgi:hypothetical protein